ncbi:hypothetical protein CCACVL1_28301 [Corchorus capsularis]|uniref:Uncharacterized protein n=1 Tax=Corchorus capsularis TaxID=210143 RepID=A0A1R3G6X8_COCAP|nr:hypothetical protein CCACVL1_28301 [Corchorus capsularis]
MAEIAHVVDRCLFLKGDIHRLGEVSILIVGLHAENPPYDANGVFYSKSSSSPLAGNRGYQPNLGKPLTIMTSKN